MRVNIEDPHDTIAPWVLLFHRQTGEKIDDAVWADTDTDEYCAYVRDGDGQWVPGVTEVIRAPIVLKPSQDAPHWVREALKKDQRAPKNNPRDQAECQAPQPSDSPRKPG